MASKFNNNNYTQGSKTLQAMKHNPDKMVWAGTDTYSEITRTANEDGTFTFHTITKLGTHSQGGKNVEVVEDRDLRPDEMTNEQFEQTRDAIIESQKEDVKREVSDIRNLGIVSIDEKVGEDDEGNEVTRLDLIADNIADDTFEPEVSHNYDDPFKHKPAVNDILNMAGLTDVQRERYRLWKGAGMSQREIAEQEGLSQKSIAESLKVASHKIQKAQEEYTDAINGRGSNFEAMARHATRTACNGCKHYNAENDTCMKSGYVEVDEIDIGNGEHVDGGKTQYQSIFEYFENNSNAKVKAKQGGGFEYVGGTCYDIADSTIDELMHGNDHYAYHKPARYPIHTKSYFEELKRLKKGSDYTVEEQTADNSTSWESQQFKPADYFDNPEAYGSTYEDRNY